MNIQQNLYKTIVCIMFVFVLTSFIIKILLVNKPLINNIHVIGKNCFPNNYELLIKDFTIGRLMSRKNGSWIKVSNKCDNKENFVEAYLKYPPKTLIYVYSPTVDKHVSNAIVSRGEYERNSVEHMSVLLSKYKGSVFIDIGANIGVYSIALAALGHRVISIECLPSNVDRLCASMKLKKRHKYLNMTIIVNAISSTNTVVGIHKWEGDKGGTYIDANTRNTNLTIETITLDNLLELYDFKEAIIKMDIEKSEDSVFKGGYTFFKNVLVHAVQLEFNKHKHLDSGRFIVQFLRSFGLEPQVPAHLKDNYKMWNHQNILFAKEYIDK